MAEDGGGEPGPEVLLIRGAEGLPGRLKVEVGVTEPRFRGPRGKPLAAPELALKRALGAVSFPADKARVVALARPYLGRHPDLEILISELEERVYGSELEVLERLRAERPTRPSAGGGKSVGDSASQ